MIASKIKYRISITIKQLLIRLGLDDHLLKNRYGERILLFHGIDRVGEIRYNSRFISQDYFDELLGFFKSHYHVISLDDFYQKKFKKGVLNIVLTFDDGLQNNFELALPILEKHQMPATFFITSSHEKKEFLWPDFLDLVSFHSTKKQISFDSKTYHKNNKNEFSQFGTTLKNHCKTLPYAQIESLFEIFREEWQQIKSDDLADYWKLMNADQLQSIAKNPLFTIGAHGITHTNLATIPKRESEAEIENGKKELEAMIGTTIDCFAFPFGAYSDETVAFCKRHGYSKIVLVDYDREIDRTNPLLRDRFVVNPYLSKELFLSCLLKGSYR